MKSSKKILAVVLAVAMLALTACGSASSSTGSSSGSGSGSSAKTTSTGGSSTDEKQTFIYVCGTEPSTLDPHMANATIDGQMALQIAEPLIMRDGNSELQPWLATSWEANEDATVWTFKLRDDVKFTDGEPFNAEAVKYNIDRIMDPEVKSPKASIVRMVDSVEVVDEFTVKFNLKDPCAVFLAQVSSYTCSMLSPKACEEYGAETGQHPVGTGPLKLKEWNYGSSITFEKNEDYWGEPATTDEVTVKIVPEDTSRVMMVKTGDADVIASVPMVQVEDLESDSNVSVIIEKGYRTIFLGMNSGGNIAPLTDVRVRQAINYAIDQQTIIDTLMRGRVTYPDSGMTSSVIDNSAKGLGCYPYDPEKAKALLAEAGYPNGFSIVLDTPEGRYAMDRQVSEVMQGMLAEVGIQAEVNVLDWGAYTERGTNGEHELFLLGMGCPTGDPEYPLYQNFGLGSQNYSFYNNDKVNKLLDEQAVITDPEARFKVMYEIQKELVDDACAVPLYYEQQTYATRSDVSGFILYPNEIINLAYLTRK